MREIKFRGRRLDNGEWAYGYLYGKSAIIELTSNYTVTSIGTIITGVDEVVIGTVGQFTGLLSKDGVEIYEGDLIQNASGRICKVVYKDFLGRWDADVVKAIGNPYDLDAVNWYRCTVVGNIYQDSELLK